MQMIELLEFFVAPIRDSQMTQMAILAVLLLILMDWLLGTATALITHSYDSTVARKGIAHKAGELCFVLLAILVDVRLRDRDGGRQHLGDHRNTQPRPRGQPALQAAREHAGAPYQGHDGTGGKVMDEDKTTTEDELYEQVAQRDDGDGYRDEEDVVDGAD